MASEARPTPGQIGWIDLTVPDAGAISDFCQNVTDWTPAPVSMGDYQDYCMNGDGKTVAGICHTRGDNASLPPAGMVYIVVADLATASQRCRARGGKLLGSSGTAGDGSRFRVIQDPAGAVAALYQAPSKAE